MKKFYKSLPFFVFFYLLQGQTYTQNFYQPMAPDLFYRKMSLSPSLKIHIFKTKLTQTKMDIIDGRKDEKKTLTIKKMAQKTNAMLVINGNFFDKSNEPLGLIIKNGKEINPAKSISWWSAFLIKKNRAQIKKIGPKENFSAYQFGIQAGPRLVVSGVTPKLKVETSPKTALGIDKKGWVYLMVSEGNIEINQFAKILATPEGPEGVGLYHALNLDGGRSTQLYTQLPNLKLDISGFVEIPIGIGLFKK